MSEEISALSKTAFLLHECEKINEAQAAEIARLTAENEAMRAALARVYAIACDTRSVSAAPDTVNAIRTIAGAALSARQWPNTMRATAALRAALIAALSARQGGKP